MNCCDNKNEEKKDVNESQLVCLVMGGHVNKEIAEEKGLVREYKGEKYYFCCAGCPEKFDKDPESYIKKNSNSKDKGCCCH